MNESSQKRNLLYVEDDYNIRENYSFVLKEYFKNIYTASNFEDAITIFNEHEIDIAIIDIKLEGYKSGIDVVKNIRSKNLNTKIIITSAYSTVENLLSLSSLNLSAFLTKPVKSQTLLDSINLALKELESIKILRQDILHLNDEYRWNFSQKELKKNNKTITLTKVEKDILQVIFSNPSIELSYDFIIDEVWEYPDKNYQETLRTLVSRIRKKLPKDTIKTLYNIGYRYL